VVAGVHGDEFEGPETIMTLPELVDSTQVSGAILGIVVANGPALAGRSRVSPLDGLNMNRVFPGNPNGSVSARLAAAVFDIVSSRCQAVIDLHSGGSTLALLPMAVWEGPERDPSGTARRFATAAGLPYLWRAHTYSGTLSQAALARGIPGVTLEIGGEGRYDTESAHLMKHAVLRMLHSLGVVPAPSTPGVPSVPVEGDFLISPCGGFFIPLVKLGQRVTEGERLGIVRDQYGGARHIVTAPCDGLVCSLRTAPPLDAGEQLALVCAVNTF